MIAFFSFIVAMFLSMLLIPPLMRYAKQFAFLDEPDERKVHVDPIPRIGGIAMVVGAVVPMLLWIDYARHVVGILIGIGIILVFGVWDDRAALNYKIKFAGQLIAVCVAVFYGGIVIKFVPFGGLEPIPPAFSYALTIFALLGITNAINLADGLDGLAGGTTLLSIGVLSVLAYLARDGQLLIMCMAVMGCIVGFLRFNTHPAQIFMGDCGSQFLGFSAGVLVIVLTQQSSTVLSPAMPLLLLGLPLIDTFLVMGQRVLERRSPFKPDRNHIHHKLLNLGLDHYESVVVIYALQATLVSLAFLGRFQSDLLNTAIFGFMLVAIASTFVLTDRLAWKVRTERARERKSAIARLAGALKQNSVLTRIPAAFAALSIPIAGIYATVSVDSVPSDGRFTGMLLWVLSLGLLLWRRRNSEFLLLERLLLYVAITTLVFYWCAGRPAAPGLLSTEGVYFSVLGVSIIIAYRFGHNRSFAVTPTDFLIILIALLVPNLTGSIFEHHYVGEVAIKTLVLFYAVELIVAESGPRVWAIRVATSAVLSVLGVRLLIGDLPPLS